MVRFGGSLAAAVALLLSLAWAGAAGTALAQDGAATAGPRGPVLGDNGYRSAIRDDGETDTDDFVGPLVEGETLSVEVRAAPGPAGHPGLRPGLHPGLVLFDPAGVERTPPLRESADGSAVSLRRFPCDRTGRWLVRVLGRDETEGAYEVRFRVGAPRGSRTQRVRFEDGAPRADGIPFEAIAGSTLDLSLRPGGDLALPPAVQVLDPDGRPVPALDGLLDRRGNGWVLQGLTLDGPDGTWLILLDPAVGPAGAPAGLTFRVGTPRRPRGMLDLDPVEPALGARDAPLEGVARSLVRLAGRGFSVAPLPTVLLGGKPAQVLSVAGGGDSLDLRLPAAPLDEPLEVAVLNPDGQAAVRPAFVRILPPGPPRVLALQPVPVTVAAGGTVTVAVSLTGSAPAEGAAVALSVEGGLASVPGTVLVPPFELGASFEVAAGKKPGTGRIFATYGRTLEVPLEVLPAPGPDEIDLSGWRLVQTDSARTFTVPAGTRLRRGACLVLARNAPRAAFETFWGTSLPADAIHIDSGDKFPSLNGDETFTLLDAAGAVVDGPTPKLVAGRVWRRIPGSPAGTATSWIDLAAAPGAATPGRTEGGVGDGVVRITEIADPPGAGQFVDEFVEVSWDQF